MEEVETWNEKRPAWGPAHAGGRRCRSVAVEQTSLCCVTAVGHNLLVQNFSTIVCLDSEIDFFLCLVL